MSQEARRFINGLSAEQRDAALETQNPVMIIAGAGSGKTRTLIGRFLHLVVPETLGGKGADPSSIMMVTFTNKAAREMRERINPVMEELRENSQHRMGRGDPWVGTFHGLSLRILRVEAARAGLGKNFSIFDESEASELASDVAESLGFTTFDVDDFFRDLEIAKARLLSSDLLQSKDEEINRILDGGGKLDSVQRRWSQILDHFETPNFTTMYSAYQKSLEEQNAVDFSDLMNRVTKLFQEHPDIRDSWRSSFRHFMVDEVQDINRAQVAWLMALTGGGREMTVDANAHDNEFAEATDGGHEINTYRVRKFPRPTVAFVGDDDQSIYAFRGSEIAVMKSLEKKFPGMEMRFLKESYRCQPSILSLANELVENNTGRYGKDLLPADPSRKAEHVQMTRFWRPEDEHAAIVEAARKHIKSGQNPSEMMVLLRTRDLSRVVARELRTAGIPVVEGKASDIRKTAEVRDAMAFTGYMTNRDAETLLRRIINKPARGLGPTSLAVVGQNAKIKNIAFIDELKSVMNGKVDLPENATPYRKAFTRSCREFGQLINEMEKNIRGAANAGEAILGLLNDSGYMGNLKSKALSSVGEEETPELMAMAPKDFLTELISLNEAGKRRQKRAEKSLAERFPDMSPEALATMEQEDLTDKAGQLSEAARRIGNLSVLITQAESFDHLDEFMQEATLEMDQSEAVAGIQVMTIHGSKGLEADHVYLPHWIEGVIPHARAEQEGPEAVEEERRLAYVALTRARESSHVSYPVNIRGYGHIRVRDSVPSRFISEMERAPNNDFVHREIFKNGNVKKISGGAFRPIVEPVAKPVVADAIPEPEPQMAAAPAEFYDEDAWRNELPHDHYDDRGMEGMMAATGIDAGIRDPGFVPDDYVPMMSDEERFEGYENLDEKNDAPVKEDEQHELDPEIPF
ncbi:MAG: ATP-dependent helicase [Roseibium sp.]|uniref:ATP-dependent helicase n=1 Tax=Roseibium sp. TaxID=1936156 RepID=UPI0032977196